MFPIAPSPLFPHDERVTKDELLRVGQAVSARRGELGLTQQDLADRAGVDLKTVYNLESGAHWPIAKNRGAVAIALGWLPDALAVIRAGRERPATPPLAAVPVSADVGDLMDKMIRAIGDPVELKVWADETFSREDREKVILALWERKARLAAELGGGEKNSGTALSAVIT
jgi:transcriptional regulator with XRE-family HTH domain